ncbi:hypothetical protein DM02DRAFT_208742 [Periconia macrospinosa]|uniref:Major facilitator superfamily (MFS) profile domain-containing protein n=1 Tax=Periconia macrospinosa TaxID=97972 RepID=A0A2V1E0H7_9PLEO|nr:hypothetical protein DM02DRAFT_208742 [Periconia macrospinosa]
MDHNYPMSAMPPKAPSIAPSLTHSLPPTRPQTGRTSLSSFRTPSFERPLARPLSTQSIAQTFTPLHEFLFIALLCSAQVTTQAALVGPLSILHVLGPALHITNPGVLAWLIAGYSLTVGSFILLSGRMGDIWGYKTMIIFGNVWFGVWSFVGGVSVWCEGEGKSILFIFSRVLAGIGPAILLPNSLGLLGATYHNGTRKNMVFSLFGACAPNGAILGATFAALWTLVWWPWVFFTYALALFCLAGLSVFVLPSVPVRPQLRNLSLRQKIAELDLVGASVGITAMILVNFAINQAPGFGWHQVYIYVMLIVGAALFPVFFWIEMYVAQKPLISFQALGIDVSFVLGCMSCGWASFGIFIYYFFQFLQLQRGLTPLLSIAQCTPMCVSGALAAICCGRIIGRVGPAWVMLISMMAFLLGNLLLATAPVQQTYWAQIFVAAIIMPWGMDMSFPAATLIISDRVKKEHQGMGASLVNTVVNYSISIGVGIAGTVEVHVNNGGNTKADELLGYRGALYMAVGLGGLGVLIALTFVGKGFLRTGEKKEDVEHMKGEDFGI